MYLQYRYPLELTRAQHARLGEILALQRHLYNAALENRRASLQAGRHLTVEDECASLGQYRRAHPEQAALPWGVNHWNLRRLDGPMQVYAPRLKYGSTLGITPFRSAGRWRCFDVSRLKGWKPMTGRVGL